MTALALRFRAVNGFRVAARVLAGLCWTSSACATSYYVSTSGSDSNSGTSTASPFLTLQTAANATQPGDTVYVMAGTYTAPCQGCDVVEILQSGTASSPITYTAYSATRPVIDTSSSWQGFHIDASYITVEGFEIVGNARSVTISQANAAASDPSYRTAGNGIQVEVLSCNYGDGQPFCESTSGLPCKKTNTTCYVHGTTPPNHLIFFDNIVHDESGSGIEVDYADYVTVSNNTVYGNANWSPYGQSGISLWELTDSDTVTSYKNYVMNNVAHSNQQMVPTNGSSPAGTITDGNGIIIDDNKKTQTSGVAYNGRTFVGNNVVYLNGGSGINAFSSQHVDIVANTAYQNNLTPSNNLGQMFSYNGADIKFLDNIMWTGSTSKPWFANTGNAATVLEDYGVLYNSTSLSSSEEIQSSVAATGAHDLFANPLFTNASSGDFSLTPISPARGAATSDLEPTTDIVGTMRPQVHGYDTGAYESTAP